MSQRVNAVRPTGAVRLSEETIGVVGKGFPTNGLGVLLSRYPTTCLAAALVLPLVFAIAALVAPGQMDVALAGFAADPSEAQQAAARTDALTGAWLDALGNRSRQGAWAPWSVPGFRQELRFTVDLARLSASLAGQPVTMGLLEERMSLVTPANIDFVRQVEQAVVHVEGYTSRCLTNDLKGGRPSGIFPPCVPPSSLTTYFFPGPPAMAADGSDHFDFGMLGNGTLLEASAPRVAARILLNSNHRWFVDIAFAATSLATRSLRTQLTFAKGSAADADAVLKDMRQLSLRVLDRVRRVSHPFITTTYGGDQVEEAQLLAAVEQEAYKAFVAAAMVLVVLFAHTRSKLLGVALLLQVLANYLAAWGIFMAWFRKPLPVFSAISFFVVLSMSLHGSLAFYDTFVHSGIMATTGRANTLSVAQRISFTLRRAGVGVWLSNIAAIAAFGVNTLSAFPAVRDFSLAMVFALLVNMYMVVLLTPAIVLCHHYYFSGKRRNTQKRRDVLANRQWGLMRHTGLTSLLVKLDNAEAPDARYDTRHLLAETAAAEQPRSAAADNINGFFKDHMDTIRSVVVEIFARKPQAAAAAAAAARGHAPVVHHDDADFVQVTLSATGGGGARAPPPPYRSRRMVRDEELLRVPAMLLARSFENSALVYCAVTPQDMLPAEQPPASSLTHVTAMEEDGSVVVDLAAEHTPARSSRVVSQRPSPASHDSPAALEAGPAGPDLSTHFVPPLPNTDIDGPEVVLPAMAQWLRIAEECFCIANGPAVPPPSAILRLLATTAIALPTAPVGVRPFHAKALVAHQLASLHDGSLLVAAVAPPPRPPSRGASSGQPSPGAASPQSDMAMSPLPRMAPPGQRRRQPAALAADATWYDRLDERLLLQNRQWCCGLLGARVDETREQRDERILRKAQKVETYGRMERFMQRHVAPTVATLRWPLAAASAVLLVVAVVLAGNITVGGRPTNVIDGSSVRSAYASTREAFAGSSDCTFCGAYYQPQAEYPTLLTSAADICQTANQMNWFADSCGVCLGNDSCVDCAGVPRGRSAILACGVCGLRERETDLCRCQSTASCSWCDLTRGTVNKSGPGCAVDCTNKCGPHGTCDPFTGACRCHDDDFRGHWAGATCGYCSNAYLPDEGCTSMCTRTITTLVCGCNLTTGQCTRCAAGYGGFDCAESLVVCRNGGVRSTTGSGCVCSAGFSDCAVAPCAKGDTCRYASQCSYRGVWHADESVASVRGCACNGNWFGPTCNLCQCQNGGSCKTDGQCACPEAFTGDQCQRCAATCSLNGACPAVLPRMLPLRSCVAQLCPNGTAMCSACQPQITIGGLYLDVPCSTFRTSTPCLARDHCYWLPSQNTCVINDYPSMSAQVRCKCKGAWVGLGCSTCGGPNGSTCLPSGSVVACDGKTYADASQAPAVDACGDCGGYGLCVGCDGVTHSGKTLDACGVCGGDNGCLGAAQSTSVGVTFVVDCTSRPIRNATVMYDLYSLQDVCQELVRAMVRGVILPGARCFARDFVTWATSPAGVASLRGTLWTVGDVYRFADARGRLGEVGFDVNSADAQTVTFMTTDVKLPVLTTAGNAAKYAAYQTMVDVAARAQAALRDAPMQVLQTSDSWANAVAWAVSLRSVRFTSYLGIGATFALVSVSFGSLRLGVLCACVTTFVLCGTLAVAHTQGWDLDAVMQICVAVVIAVGCEHVVHIADGYQDFLQSTQSHMFAVQTSRFHAFRGALLRTGLSVLSSTVAMVCVAAIFLSSAIQPFRRAAQVIVTVHLLALVSVVLFGAWLCILGPLKLLRHWTVSLIMSLGLGFVGGVAFIVIALVGSGITGPSGSRVI